jgi:hypothetical protein
MGLRHKKDYAGTPHQYVCNNFAIPGACHKPVPLGVRPYVAVERSCFPLTSATDSDVELELGVSSRDIDDAFVRRRTPLGPADSAPEELILDYRC